MPRLGETPTGASNRPQSVTVTYKEVMANIKIAISKENYPEDKLTEVGQDHILKDFERRTATSEVLQAGGRRTH
jgi:hypothetical protein